MYTTDPTAGHVTSAAVTEATGLVRTLSFTDINGVDVVTAESSPCVDCGDKTAAMTYDSNGYMQSKTDFDGNVTQYVHDSFGNETFRTEAYGTQDARTITTAWNYGVNQPALITEPGRTTAYTYDGVGHVLSKTVTDTVTSTVRSTTYAYYSSGTAAGLLETVTDPMSHVTSYTYDTQGNLYTITNALGQVTQITQYDANGMPLTIVDPNGVITTLTYDGRQRLLTRTVAGAETQFTYDLVGNLTQVTLPTGSSLTYTYDTAHRLTGISDSVGDSTTYTLDNLGNRTHEQTKDPSGTLQKTLQRTYNNLNQLHTLMGGAGQTTTYTDDPMGNSTSIQDPMTNVTGQSFDALNRLATVVDPESGNTTYNYDPLDRVNDVTDPKGLNTDYSYDAFGDVTQQVSPDTGTTAYTYDLDGNRLTKTDARGITALYSYDALNRLTGITYPDASRDVAYTYDQNTYGIGHLSGIQDVSGTTAYQYDAHGNTTQKAVTLGSHTFTLAYQYDTADNLTGMTYPDGMQVNYGRDTAERITSVTTTSSTIVSGITYEPFGPITGLTYGNGLTETRSYDQDYRLTGINVPGVLNWMLVPNADDDITSITDNINSANSQTLGYDSLNRLTSATGTYGTQSYLYDLDGNRYQETLAGTTTNLGYDTASNKLLTVGAQSDTYDVVGNLTSDANHSYDYDAANRLTGFDSTPTAYFYNGLGQRVTKFAVDNTAPTISITAPASGAVSGTVNVTANVVDDFGASVQFQLDGANLGAPVTTEPYTTSWVTTTATAGAHTLTAIATDPGSNTTTSAAVNVTVDNIPPSVAMTAPANGADVSGTVNVSATASDNVSVAKVQFQLDGANLGAPVTSAPYTYSWDTTTATGGAHTLTAIATDEAGNTTTSSAVTVTADDTPPVVGITSPASGSVSGTVTVTANASASDGVGVASVQFQLDGADLGPALTAAPYTYSWDTTAAVGSHTLTAIAIDAVGNTATSTPVNVTVLDVTPPTVSLTAPASGASVSGTVNVTASASDNVGVTSVQFQLDGANLGAAVTASPYTFSWNTTTATGGTHTLTAVASDAAGNTTTSTAVTVTVDDTPPTVSITSPATASDVAGTINVSATASDNVSVASVQLQLDGASLGLR